MNRPLSWIALLLLGCAVDGRVGLLDDGVDDDGDGFAENEGDCNDDSEWIAPGKAEACDGLDNDCDGIVDGNDACARQDEFDAIALLDFLVVVDNSAGMIEEQGKLRDGIGNLVQPMLGDGRDIHVGVITTDMTDPAQQGRLITVEKSRWIDSTWDPGDATRWLELAVDVGTSADATEQARAAIFSAIQTANPGFRRDQADLAVLIVSNEDDASPSPTLEEFLEWVDVEVGAERFQAHAIVSTEAVSSCNPGSDSMGVEHLELVLRTDGSSVDICMATYDQDLSLIGQQSVTEALPYQFRLRHAAVPDTIVVEVYQPWGAVDLLDPSRYVYSAVDQTVLIHGVLPPPADSTVVVNYDAVPIPPG